MAAAMTSTVTGTQVNRNTLNVALWFELPKNKPRLEEIVRVWNRHKLLGIDLADTLQHTAERAGIATEGVEWSRLAEKYALEICGVDELELTRRREQHER